MWGGYTTDSDINLQWYQHGLCTYKFRLAKELAVSKLVQICILRCTLNVSGSVTCLREKSSLFHSR